MSVDAYKLRIDSQMLGRPAHADVFRLASPPKFVLLLFGGSGIDEEEYVARATTVTPAFDAILPSVDEVPCVLAHVTAPYDVPFARFDAEVEWRQRWNVHVADELLAQWPALPYVVAGFSGGAVLALSGVHLNLRCLGGAVFGADAIPRRFRRPGHWSDPLQAYCGQSDRVCNHATNARTIDDLVVQGHAVRHTVTAAHRLADYATDESLGRQLRIALNAVS